jgi:hypothetical protein
MKKLIYSSIYILTFILFYSCEVEKIQPGEIVDPNVIVPEAVEAYTPPPCTVDSNKYRFNGVTYTINTVEVDSSYSVNAYCTNATYLITGSSWSSNTTLQLYFRGKPKTGIYSTVENNSLPENISKPVYLTISPSYGQTYRPGAGILVYVNNNGTSVKASFCPTTFYYFDNSFSFGNNFGQIVAY